MSPQQKETEGSMERARYEVDPYNRLVIYEDGTQGDLEKFRQVLDGQFKVDERNNLSYHIKAPLSEDENIPSQVKLTGDWSLTDNHELRLTLDKESRDTFGDEITLQGQILDVDKNSLLFSMMTKTKEGGQSTYVLNIQGSWKADENNRLSFYVRREDGRYDILTFGLAWDMGEDNQIIYQYEKASLIRKKSEVHALIFRGHWDIKDKVRISYILDADTGPAFDFESSVGILEENYIKYNVGIILEREVEPVRRVIALSGEWKLKKDAGLSFEVEYENGKIYAISFGADITLTDKDMLSFKLKDSIDNKDLGMTIELSQNILCGYGELFLRALASRREVALYAGAAWRF